MHGFFPNITYYLIKDIKKVWKTVMNNGKWATGELQIGYYEYSVLGEIITTWEWGGIREIIMEQKH